MYDRAMICRVPQKLTGSLRKQKGNNVPRKNNRPDARRDANEPKIVRALEKHGYPVQRIGSPGDLLIWNFASRTWVVLEVKMPNGRLTPKQQTYREDNPDVDIPTVTTSKEALQAVLIR
jgi:hypothetical protein